MPAIGVVASNRREAHRYLEAVSKRGVEEVLLAPRPLARVQHAMSAVDALIFTGGPDVDPHRYGESRDAQAGLETSQRRDRWEIAVLRAALQKDMPVLAICRGMQLLNVAFGGKLLQDLPGHRKESDNGGWESAFHQIYISPGSKLAAILGSGGFVQVNSQHHQGLGEPQKATALLASAYSLSDGLIEALESPQHDWVIGVQWHNELEEELHRSFGNLFQALIERADRRARAKDRQPTGVGTGG
ncbi:MAG: gamma-glutamyl-gamma-aminobutyrate hydrolase family protein [Chloroflexi bacterium]|nr:gamma-glutamyl-gamma-aminobutyrate hydrolase family protein [Chloroflexota bacterium]